MERKMMFALGFIPSFIASTLIVPSLFIGFSVLGGAYAIILAIFKKEIEKEGKYFGYGCVWGVPAGFLFGSFLNGFRIGFGLETKAYFLIYGIMFLCSIIGVLLYEHYSKKSYLWRRENKV